MRFKEFSYRVETTITLGFSRRQHGHRYWMHRPGCPLYPAQEAA